MENVYEQIRSFKRKYPMTVAWRLKKHSRIVKKHLNPSERIIYIFA